jgi:hypothetical protein
MTDIASDVMSEISNGDVLLDLGQMTSSSKEMFSHFLDECDGGGKSFTPKVCKYILRVVVDRRVGGSDVVKHLLS